MKALATEFCKIHFQHLLNCNIRTVFQGLLYLFTEFIEFLQSLLSLVALVEHEFEEVFVSLAETAVAGVGNQS